ncbi:MAG: hypothetical protein RL717_2518 [Pseudomonadota bacterium]|jgi:prevent-host-death family protein
MQPVNIHEAKSQLSRLIESALQGEEVIISRAGKPVARLIPIAAKPPIRKPGSLKGLIRIAKDFDAPLPHDLQQAFEGN